MDHPHLQQAVSILSHSLKALGKHHNGFSGNCAKVARILDDILGTGGDYVVVAGEHYHFADHLFLRWNGFLWDMAGAHTWEDAENAWANQEEDEPAGLEEFIDPGGALILKMADENAIFAGGFEEQAFRRELEERLLQEGFAQACPAANLPEPGATPPKRRKARIGSP